MRAIPGHLRQFLQYLLRSFNLLIEVRETLSIMQLNMLLKKLCRIDNPPVYVKYHRPSSIRVEGLPEAHLQFFFYFFAVVNKMICLIPIYVLMFARSRRYSQNWITELIQFIQINSVRQYCTGLTPPFIRGRLSQFS